MQSIFGPAARRERLREPENAEHRDGELKMDRTNVLRSTLGRPLQ